MAKKIRIALLIVILVISGYSVFSSFYDQQQTQPSTQAIDNPIVIKQQLQLKNRGLNSSQLQYYANINADTLAYLEIPGADIAYPIMQTDNNDYYLDHAYDGSKHHMGSIFMEQLNKPDFSDQNTVIYGHNMNKPGMFYNLVNYRNQEFFDANQIITIKLPQRTLTYQVFSVYVTEPDYPYRLPNYKTEAGYQDFIDRITSRSMVHSDTPVTSKDHILTLSTCVYDFKDARFAVHAVLIDSVAHQS